MGIKVLGRSNFFVNLAPAVRVERHWRTVKWFLVLLLAACACGSDSSSGQARTDASMEVAEEKYTCRSDDECAIGFECMRAQADCYCRCAPKGSGMPANCVDPMCDGVTPE